MMEDFEISEMPGTTMRAIKALRKAVPSLSISEAFNIVDIVEHQINEQSQAALPDDPDICGVAGCEQIGEIIFCSRHAEQYGYCPVCGEYGCVSKAHRYDYAIETRLDNNVPVDYCPHCEKDWNAHLSGDDDE